MAKAFGAEVEMRDLGVITGGYEALIAPAPKDRFLIWVDPRPPRSTRPCAESVLRRRMRFRVAHELGHTLFYERTPGTRPVHIGRGGDSEEAFCDEFASALLFPREVAETADLSQAQSLADQYDVSVEVVIRSIAAWQAMELTLMFRDGDSFSVQWSNASRVPADLELVCAPNVARDDCLRLNDDQRVVFAPRFAG